MPNALDVNGSAGPNMFGQQPTPQVIQQPGGAVPNSSQPQQQTVTSQPDTLQTQPNLQSQPNYGLPQGVTAAQTQQAPAAPASPGQPLNVFGQGGVQGGGGFLPGPAQIQNASGPPSNVSFQPANGNPFGAQASGIYSGGS